MRRGSSEKFIMDGPAIRNPPDFKLFLANDENKLQLCHLLSKVWSSNETASRLEKNCNAVVTVEGRDYQLVSSNGEVSEMGQIELVPGIISLITIKAKLSTIIIVFKICKTIIIENVRNHFVRNHKDIFKTS